MMSILSAKYLKFHISRQCHRLVVLLCFLSLFFSFSIAFGQSTPKSQDAVLHELNQYFSIEWCKPFPLSGPSKQECFIIISGQYILVFRADGQLACLDVQTGDTKWQTSIGTFKREVVPCAGDECVVAHIDANYLVAFGLTDGQIKWKFENNTVLGLPIFSRGKAFFGSDDGHFYAVDQQTGTIIWQNELPVYVWTKPAVIEGICCVLTNAGYLVGYDVTEGRELWKSPVGEGTLLPIVTVQGRFIVFSEDRKLSAFDYKTGKMLWQIPVSSLEAPPIVVSDMLGVFGQMNQLGILDSLDGRFVWRGSYAGSITRPPAASDNFIVYGGYERLRLFDIEKGFERLVLNVPDNFQVATGNGSIFFTQPEKWLCRAKLNPQMLFGSPQAIASTAFPRISWRDTGDLFFIIVFFMIFVIFLFMGRAQIPPTYETFIRIWILAIILAILCLINGYGALIIISYNFRHGFEIWSLVYAAMLVIPSIVILSSYPLFHWITNLRYGYLTKQKQTVDRSIYSHIQALTQEMELKYPVAMTISAHPGMTPFAIGCSSWKCRLVLPPDLKTLINKACNGVSFLEEGLIRLILAHELAHIRNRDLSILPLLWIIRNPLKWLLILSTAYFIVCRFVVNDALVMLVGGPLVFLNLAVGGFLSLAFVSVIREREQLADATALLYVSPDVVSQLSQEKAAELSPLEKLIFSFTTAFSFSRSYLGFDLPLNRSYFRFFYKLGPYTTFVNKKLSSFQQALFTRLQALVSKSAALPRTMLPTWKTVCLIAITMAFLFSLLRLTKYFAFTSHILSDTVVGDAHFPDGFLRGMETWREVAENSIFWYPDYDFYFKLLLACTAACFLLLPMRDITIRPEKIKMRSLFQFVCLVLFYYLVFSISSYLLHGLIQPPFPTFPGMEITSNLTFITLMMTLFFGSVLLILKTLNAARFLFLFIGTLLGLACLFIPAVLVLQYGVKLPISSRVLLCGFAALITSLLNVVPILKLLTRNEEYEYEGIRYWRLLWKRKFDLLLGGKNFSKLVRHLKWTFHGLVITQAMPFILVCLVGYIFLVQFDSWYFENTVVLQQAHRALIDSAVDRIQSGTWDLDAKRRLFLGLFHGYVGPDRQYPSAVLAFAVVGCGLFFTAFCFAISALRGESKKTKFWRAFPNVLVLSEVLKCSRILKNLTACFASKTSFRLCGPSYITGIERIPLMKTTCHVISFLNSLNPMDCRVQKMSEWVKKCMSSTGGFAAMPGMTADTIHTGAALRMLSDTGRISEIALGKQQEWLLRQLHLLLETKVCYLTDYEWLTTLCDIIKSMLVISPDYQFPAKEATKMMELSTVKWQNTGRSIKATNRYVSILVLLCPSDGAGVFDKIRADWLPRQEQRLVTLSPSAQLPEISVLVGIIIELFPYSYLERASIRQVKDSLEKVYTKKFSYFAT